MASQSQLNQLQSFSDIKELIANAVVDRLINPQDGSNIVNQKLPKTPFGEDEIEGFSLQPIDSLLHQHTQQQHTESDDSPPTDSLRSIKSIAEEKKRKFLEKSRTLPTTTSSTSKVRRDLSRILGESGISAGARKSSNRLNSTSTSSVLGNRKRLTNAKKRELIRM